MRMISVILVILFFMAASSEAQKPLIQFNCEESRNICWKIPDWAYNNPDYSGIVSEVSSDVSTEGGNALKVMGDFPGDKWKAVIVECERNIDLTGYEIMTADIFLPKDAPKNALSARFIITAGNWHFIENKKETKLRPGEWITIEGRIGGERFNDRRVWKCESDETCILANMDDIKRLGIRIEYNAGRSNAGPGYNGPVYIDNIEIR